MPSVLKLKGELDTETLEDAFLDVLSSFNKQAAAGNEFVHTRTTQGDLILFRLADVSCIRSVDISDDQIPSI